MGFFDLFKKNVTCTRCNISISASDAKTLKGLPYCPHCYRRLQQAEQPARDSWDKPETPAREPQRPERSFEDKYGRGGSTGSSGRDNDRFSSSDRDSGASGCPATIADIRRTFEETNTKFRESNSGSRWEIVAGFSDKGKSYMIKFISTGGDVLAIRVFELLSVEKSQYANVLPVLNKLQDQYRFLRFTLDADGDINVEYDVVCCSRDAGKLALEMAIRITKILDDAYPELKRAVYL